MSFNLAAFISGSPKQQKNEEENQVPKKLKKIMKKLWKKRIKQVKSTGE
jgi:hypothetical protein